MLALCINPVSTSLPGVSCLDIDGNQIGSALPYKSFLLKGTIVPVPPIAFRLSRRSAKGCKVMHKAGTQMVNPLTALDHC